jgi:hypothetical protein
MSLRSPTEDENGGVSVIPPTPIFKGEHEDHEGFGNCYISISYFVLFATFVVKSVA